MNKRTAYEDLTGKQFGMLTVLRLSETRKYGAISWVCVCACGTEKIVSGSALRTGNVTSCGCRKRAVIQEAIERGRQKRVARFGELDIIGRRFGSLTVIAPSVLANGHSAWLCGCDCGRQVKRLTSSLVGKWENISCGCRKAVSRRVDRTGKRFGRLVVLSTDEDKTRAKNRLHVFCRCDCGAVVSVQSQLLASGHTQSCGCLQRESISDLGATVGVKNGMAQSKYAWHVKSSGKQITLRSSFEVIFAQYLVKHHIRFEYEPERIKLAPDVTYIPDFYLPDTKTWVEVKGYASERWLRKRRMFENTGRRLLVVTQASIESYLPGITYYAWMKRNAAKYLR